MKKMFFICCTALSILALSTSANVNRHQNFSNNIAVNDTVPSDMADTMHNNMQQNQQNNMMKDSGMNMKTDSTSTVPPQQ